MAIRQLSFVPYVNIRRTPPCVIHDGVLVDLDVLVHEGVVVDEEAVVDAGILVDEIVAVDEGVVVN